MLSFDEWNVWFHSHGGHKEIPDWSVAPPIVEDDYTVEDALVVGGMLITLLNHCDRVKIACLAQVVNVIAPIMTVTGGPAWRQTIFHPFAQASRFGRGSVLRQVVESPRYDARGRPGVPCLKSACVLEPATGGLTVFALNRCFQEELELTVELRALGNLRVAEWLTLRHDDLKAVNTRERPDNVAPQAAEGASVAGGTLTAVLQPASWNVLRLSQAG